MQGNPKRYYEEFNGIRTEELPDTTTPDSEDSSGNDREEQSRTHPKVDPRRMWPQFDGIVEKRGDVGSPVHTRVPISKFSTRFGKG